MRKNVAILTNFMDFNSGYSLTGIVLEQCYMLLREGHKVYLFVNEQFTYAPSAEEAKTLSLLWLSNKYGKQFAILQKTLFMHLTDYQSKTDISSEHIKQAVQASDIYVEEMKKIKPGVVFTHDFIFTGWNLPYARAIDLASNRLDKRIVWFHWIHSVPSAGRDWWDLKAYGNNHYIVFPNKTEQTRVAEQYRTNPLKVLCIPHVKDIRNYYEFGYDARYFTEIFPEIMKASIVQVYPASTDRLSAKQLDSVIKIFGYFKARKFKVFLLIANQWATGRQAKERLSPYIELAHHCGLEYGDDFAFTSLTPSENKRETPDFDMSEALDHHQDDSAWFPYAKGISKRTLRELQLLSNLFIFPTMEESFGLVGPEASYSGALVVINKSLTMMYEVMGHMTPAYDFGSHHQNHPPAKEDEYLGAVANAILNRLLFNESMVTRTRAKIKYSMDHIYNRYYLPLLMLEGVE